MERRWLDEELEKGRSIESIAREVGRDPSTVAYWVKEHGLASAHAARHAARGGLERDVLAELVARDLSVREIAAAVDRSVGTVRHWLKRHGLATTPAARKTGPKLERFSGICATHGTTDFVLRRGSPQCLACRAGAVADWRRRTKATLIAEAGGCCVLCGYYACPAALQFHHLDPASKEFGIGSRGLGRAITTLRAEAAKCVLVCSNCHAELESGHQRLDLQSASAPRSSGVAQANPG